MHAFMAHNPEITHIIAHQRGQKSVYAEFDRFISRLRSLTVISKIEIKLDLFDL
jgi:hypothetical protein